MSRITAAVLLTAALGTPAFAQAPALRFQWVKGQTLDFTVSQTTVIRETLADDKGGNPGTTEVRTSLDLTKRWTVKDVDAAGAATLELVLTRMRQEFRQADGTTTTTDSADPADAKRMAGYLNKPVLTVKVDPLGKVIDVTESQPGAAERVKADLPFRLVLPAAAPAAGQTWTRDFAVKVDPPRGTGESYDATQTFTLKGTKDGLAVVGVATALKAPPKTADEQMPLVSVLWAGEIHFDPAAGRVRTARLTAKADFPAHQGPGSRFVHESSYNEDAVVK